MFHHTVTINSGSSVSVKRKSDPNNLATQNMTHLVSKIVSLVQQRITKGVGETQRDIGSNKVVQEAGFKYNLKKKEEEGQIVGGL